MSDQQLGHFIVTIGARIVEGNKTTEGGKPAEKKITFKREENVFKVLIITA